MKQFFILFLLLFFNYLKINCQITNNFLTTKVIPELTTTTTLLPLNINKTITTTTSTTTSKQISTTTTTTIKQLKQTSFPVSTTQLELKIGILGVNGSQYRSSYGFGQSVPAISIAIQRARDEHLIDNVNFTFTWLICDCDPIFSVGSANQLILNENVDVIIGPPCAATYAGLSAGFYNMPIFVWGAAVSSILNDYPTLTNINSNTKLLAKAVEAVLMQFQWYEISFVYIPDNIRRVGLYFPQDFQSVMVLNPNLTIVFNQQMDDTPESMHNTLLQISNRSRIVVVTIDALEARRNFLLAITDMGFAQSNEYVFIIVQLRNIGMSQQVSSNGSNVSKYNNFWMTTNGINDGRDDDALKAARRVIIVDLENQSGSEIDSFMAKMGDEIGKPPFNCRNECMGGPEDQTPSLYSRSLHDTTYAYLKALNSTSEKFGYLNKNLVRNGTIINNMSRSIFNGQTGQVLLDENGNRQPNFFLNLLDVSDQPIVVMNISVVAGVAVKF